MCTEWTGNSRHRFASAPRSTEYFRALVQSAGWRHGAGRRGSDCHPADPGRRHYGVSAVLRRAVAAALLAVTLAAAAFLAAGAKSSWAQTTTGAMRGVVLSVAGVPVQGVEIVMEHHETGLRTTVQTTSEGTFARTLLPLGTYDVTAITRDGLTVDRREGLVLRVGETLLLTLGFAPPGA